MEHIAAENGSVIEMAQKVLALNYQICYFFTFLLAEFDQSCFNCQILMTGGFWKFVGDGCCLGI